MLPCKNRLLETKDFEAINRTGSFFSFGDVFLKIKENKLKKTRIGFSIGLKFSPKAVVRNRVKRQLREIVRKEMENIKEGLDIMISLKKSAKKEFSSQELRDDFLGALKKAKLI